MTQITDKVYAVEVPDDAKDIKILKGQPEILDYDYPGKSGERDTQWLNAMIDLPPGTWRFLFTTKTAKEEDARKAVKELPVGARWMNYNGDYPVWYHTARESLHSLLRSKGLDDKNNYALIEKL